jgi:ATP-binding cassette subfamily F protein 3
LLLGKDKSAGNKTKAPAARAAQEEKVNKKEQRQQSADRRNELKPLRERLTRLEREISKCQVSKAVIEEKLAEAGLYDDARKDELNGVLFEQAKVASALQALEEEWLAVSESLEANA